MSLKLELFVSGESAHGQRALRNVRALFDELFPDQYALEIIDARANPEVARQAGVRVTPSLICANGSGTHQVVGDLSDHRQLLDALELAG